MQMKTLNKFVPGQRIIKTALSVSMSIYILKLLTADTSLYFYAAISAVMAMQNSMEKSYRIGVTRILGTIVGGIIAIILTMSTKALGLDVDNVFVIFIAITIAIKLCVLFNIREGVVVCCILYLSSVSIQLNNDYVMFVFYRLLATILGILVTLSVNKINFSVIGNLKSLFIKPPR